MKQILIPAVMVTLVLTILTGLVYPLVMTGLSQVLFPHQANGSLITVNGKIVGSALIGQKFRQENPTYTGPIPADLLTMSASGLDPHISPASAFAQVDRVAKARGLTADAVRQVVDRHVEGRQFGIFGEPRVNVLALNLDLDKTLAAAISK